MLKRGENEKKYIKLTFYLILCIIIGTRQNLGFKKFLSNSFQIYLYLKFITLRRGIPKTVLLSSLDPNPIYHASFLIIL